MHFKTSSAMRATTVLLAISFVCALDPVLPAGPDLSLSAQVTGAPGGQAQTSSSRVEEVTRVKLRDGTTLFGTVTRETESELELRLLSGGTVTLDLETVRERDTVRGIVKNGSFYPPDPNTSRLFLGPTARTLPKGEGYFGVYEVVVPFLAVGVTDWLTLGGGTPLAFSLDQGPSTFWITPKIRLLHREKLDVAVGSFLFFERSGNESFGAIHYAVMTAGDERASFTAGGGVFQGSLDEPAVLMVGGQARTSRRTSMMVEGYLLDGMGLAIFGPRFIGESLSADLGLAVPFSGGGAAILPVVNFAVAW